MADVFSWGSGSHIEVAFFLSGVFASAVMLLVGLRHRILNLLAFVPVLVYPLAIIWVLDVVSPRGNANDLYTALCFAAAYLVFVHACFARLYSLCGLKEASSGKASDSIFDCLYFSIITWCTVGYGDLAPSSKASRALAAYEAVTGYLTLASIFAALTAAFAVHH